MSDAIDPSQLLRELQALRAERDALVLAAERMERTEGEQQRQLIEEQDRFVSRLLQSHEAEVGRLNLELTEARTTADRLQQKHERDRTSSARLEEDLIRTRVELDRIRAERDSARTDTRHTQHSFVTAQAEVERLQAELSIARSMLEDAMDTAPTQRFQSVEPKPSSHEVSRPPRESGIVNRRIPRPRLNTPRAHAAVGGSVPDSNPPSSR